MKRHRLAFATMLLLTGCAAGALPGDAPSEVPEAGPVATGVVKGAVRGAVVCALPLAAGSYLGPVGVAIGAYIALHCLPFGIGAGAVVGGISAIRWE
jgi:hypothetical protein